MAAQDPNPGRFAEKNPYVDKLDRWSSHAQILNLIKCYPPKTKILDIGAASGTLARHTRENDFDWYGIEPQINWSHEALPYYKKILNVRVEDVPGEFLIGYQVVICGDVLEHLPDPKTALARLVKMQYPGTIFIISVPNIANVWIRIQLLLGHFDYTDRGILDRTHLHFYTRKSFLQLVQGVNLQIKKVQVTPVPLGLVHSFFRERALGRLIMAILAFITSVFPTLLGYQWLVIAKKEKDEPK